jgi:hypothetical protein
VGVLRATIGALGCGSLHGDLRRMGADSYFQKSLIIVNLAQSSQHYRLDIVHLTIHFWKQDQQAGETFLLKKINLPVFTCTCTKNK